MQAQQSPFPHLFLLCIQTKCSCHRANELIITVRMPQKVESAVISPSDSPTWYMPLERKWSLDLYSYIFFQAFNHQACHLYKEILAGFICWCCRQPSLCILKWKTRKEWLHSVNKKVASANMNKSMDGVSISISPSSLSFLFLSVSRYRYLCCCRSSSSHHPTTRCARRC